MLIAMLSRLRVGDVSRDLEDFLNSRLAVYKARAEAGDVLKHGRYAHFSASPSRQGAQPGLLVKTGEEMGARGQCTSPSTTPSTST